MVWQMTSLVRAVVAVFVVIKVVQGILEPLWLSVAVTDAPELRLAIVLTPLGTASLTVAVRLMMSLKPLLQLNLYLKCRGL